MGDFIASLQWLWLERYVELTVVVVAVFAIVVGFIGLFKNKDNKFWGD